ncbi:anti-sigma factor [Paenibacillus sp. FSL L8-0463]|uniref:anti-sigma factor n=1 Tax=Paenibacillus sp. FSL L8-0463 TaxID=2954687 RepID=UPI00311A603D
MSEEFKEKLRKYSEGTLPEEERTELEQELEKLEAYQVYVDELMEREDHMSEHQEVVLSNGKSKGKGKSKRKSASGREKGIIRRGKWRARIANTFTVLAAFLVFSTISSIITAVFYSTGDRGDIYRDVVSSAIAVSRPNTIVHLSSNAKFFFRMEMSGKLLKQIGGETVDVGSYSTPFLLGLGGVGKFSWTDERSGGNYYFQYPETGKNSGSLRSDGEEWRMLEKLHEGTVAEAYLSLDRLNTTDELLKKLEPLNLQPVWFAADAGQFSRERFAGTPLGFPYTPLWHADDMKVTKISEEKTGWFSKVTSSSSASPAVESYGDGALREENFMDTLRLMQQHKKISNNVAPFINLDESISYLAEHGVKLYGVVVTGPVKELLKLEENTWISNIRVGEVRLWNWRE